MGNTASVNNSNTRTKHYNSNTTTGDSNTPSVNINNTSSYHSPTCHYCHYNTNPYHRSHPSSLINWYQSANNHLARLYPAPPLHLHSHRQHRSAWADPLPAANLHHTCPGSH